MFEVINQLKERKQRLANSFRKQKKEYRSKVSRIDRAINNFEKGIKELHEDESGYRPSRADQIEEILCRRQKPLHLKQILKELSHGSEPPPPYQSLSRLMQSHAKRNKRFTRVAPATFALIENNESIKTAGGRRK